MTDAPDSTPADEPAGDQHAAPGAIWRRALAAAARPPRIVAPCADDRGLVDGLERLRVLMTVRGPITAAAVAAVAVAAMLSVSLAACGEDTTTVTQPLASDAAVGRAIGGAPATRSRGGARGAAQAFVSSYLAISYGQAPPSQLRGASRALHERLDAQHARVPPGVRDRRPRVVAMRLNRTGDGRVRAIATVDDGDLAPYPLFATLQRTSSGRWVAVSVGG